MKRNTLISFISAFAIFIALGAWGTSATWTLSKRDACTVNSTSDWRQIVPLGTIYKGQGGTILDVYDDWIKVKVASSKDKSMVGKEGWVWIKIVSNAVILSPGAILCGNPGNDEQGKRVEINRIGLLYPGDNVTIPQGAVARPTWYLLEIATSNLQCRGWVYSPYGVVK